MIEYWAVIGLACLDDEFREALEEIKDDVELDKFLKGECFRLSRYERGEIKRLMRKKGVINGMKKIYASGWERRGILRACTTARTFDSGYFHASFVTVDGEPEIVLSPMLEENAGRANTQTTSEAIIFKPVGAKKSPKKSASTKKSAQKPSGAPKSK